MASGTAAEFARADLVEAFFYQDDGIRRSLKLSSETKSGRVEEVKVVPTPTRLTGYGGLPQVGWAALLNPSPLRGLNLHGASALAQC